MLDACAALVERDKAAFAELIDLVAGAQSLDYLAEQARRVRRADRDEIRLGLRIIVIAPSILRACPAAWCQRAHGSVH